MRWRIVIWITIQATRLSGTLIRKREQIYEFEEFSTMPMGSLGRTYYETLIFEELTFQPNLIRHDLKHVLLDYSMAIKDELKIHAFLIGNQSYNPLAILYLLLCLTIVPEMIPALRHDFKRGKKTPSLRMINLNDWLLKDMKECRHQLKIHPNICS